MYNYFRCKIRYEKILEDGRERAVTEEYLVDALSFSEAEARIIKEVEPFVNGEFTVSDISRYRINESFIDLPGDKFYKAKLEFLTLDEKSGNEKKTPYFILVKSSNIDDAKQAITDEMKKTMIDYNFSKIEETKIIDVFLYSGE